MICNRNSFINISQEEIMFLRPFGIAPVICFEQEDILVLHTADLHAGIEIAAIGRFDHPPDQW